MDNQGEFWCDKGGRPGNEAAFRVEEALDIFFETMPKKAKHSNRLGRPEVVNAEELLDRFKALKRFLEDNWGRIGLELQRVRQPDHVGTILKLVPGADWCTPFRDHPAACLLKDGKTKVLWRELRVTRQLHKDAYDIEGRLWSEYHSTRQKAEEARTALKAVISQFEAAIGLYPFFLVVVLIAKELGVEELTKNSNRLEASLHLAQNEKQELKERLSSQEAWYARNETVRFAKISPCSCVICRNFAVLPE